MAGECLVTIFLKNHLLLILGQVRISRLFFILELEHLKLEKLTYFDNSGDEVNAFLRLGSKPRGAAHATRPFLPAFLPPSP